MKTAFIKVNKLDIKTAQDWKKKPPPADAPLFGNLMFSVLMVKGLHIQALALSSCLYKKHLSNRAWSLARVTFFKLFLSTMFSCTAYKEALGNMSSLSLDKWFSWMKQFCLTVQKYYALSLAYTRLMCWGTQTSQQDIQTGQGRFCCQRVLLYEELFFVRKVVISIFNS